MIDTTFVALVHAIAAITARPLDRLRTDARRVGDRGAVSIEQVLWYAAAAVSVAVVAAIIWSQIKSTASTGVDTPSAP